METLKLSDLQDTLTKMGIHWEASENEISGLLRADMGGNLFGLSIPEESRSKMLRDAKSAEPPSLLAAKAPPEAVDWRNERGSNWVTEVKNQGICGSCVSFATCAALETRIRLKLNNPELDIDLSAAHLFFCGAGEACEQGWDFDPALKTCKDQGVGLEVDFPYSDHNQLCQSIEAVVKVPFYDREVTQDARLMAIASNGPVVAGMRVYEDFSYYKGGTYQHVAGALVGQHAVTIVGYDDRERYWIIKNSWGTNWGENGFCKIAYGNCGLDMDFPFYDPHIVYFPSEVTA